MLNASDLAALCEARHGDPFAVLGPHADANGQVWLRALVPGARSVTAVDPGSQAPLAELQQRNGTGLFEALVGASRRPYRLRITWADGRSGVYADAYAFGAALGEHDVYFLGEGSHLRPYEALGAHLMQADDGAGPVEGTRFAVWAPNASRVSVVGEFQVATERLTATRQFSCLPTCPQYCRATPTECLPFFGKPVSSTIQATTDPSFSIAGIT